MNWGMKKTKCPECGDMIWHPMGIHCIECDKWFHKLCFFQNHDRRGLNAELDR